MHDMNTLTAGGYITSLSPDHVLTDNLPHIQHPYMETSPHDQTAAAMCEAPGAFLDSCVHYHFKI